MAEEALLNWAQAAVTQDEIRPETFEELSDGKALAGLLQQVDQSFFSGLQHDASIIKQRDLVAAFFADVVHAALPASSRGDTSLKGHVTRVLALTVQSDKAQRFVAAIQQLPEPSQEVLMRAIETITSSLERQKPSASLDVDRLSVEQLKATAQSVITERDTLQGTYDDLHAQFTALQQEKDDLKQAQLDQQEGPSSADLSADEDGEQRQSRVVSISKPHPDLERRYRAELDRLQAELNTTSNTLAEAEVINSSSTSKIEQLTVHLQEAQAKAELADRLKDEVDELRHASDRLIKAEAVLEKYKKKLDEAADTRRSLKALETQNGQLVDANAALEEQNSSMKAYKPLLDQYKTQISTLEGKLAATSKQNESLTFELQRTSDALRTAEEERDSREAQQQELDMQSIGQELAGRKAGRSTDSALAASNGISSSADLSTDEDEDASAADDSFDTNTMTQLRQQVRTLQKQLASSSTQGSGSNQSLILQNLLEDANRMKARYEADYLTEMRAKLRAEGQLEEIRKSNGKEDGPTVIALRLRLNEVVEELDGLNKAQGEASEKLERAQEELVVVKSDLSLVNQDQLAVVRELRASVSQETDGLQSQVGSLKKQLSTAEESSKMQSSQIQKLLMDKIDLQDDSISQRDRMLARERDFASLKRKAGSGQAGPAALSQMEEQLKMAHHEVLDLQDKLDKARIFIRQQDALAREKYTALGAQSSDSQSSAESTARIKELELELEKALSATSDLHLKYRKEQSLMLSSWQKISLDRLRSLSATSSTEARGSLQSGSWLAAQRSRASAASGR